MGWQAPGGCRVEQVVLEREIARVGPVVRNVGTIVVAHHSSRRLAHASRLQWPHALVAAIPRFPDEAVHPPPVDIGNGALVTMRTAGVDVLGVVERSHACAMCGVRQADTRLAVGHRYAVGPAEGAEVTG